MTFLVLVATFIGCSCLIVPLVILAAFALFGRGDEAPVAPTVGPDGVTRRGG